MPKDRVLITVKTYPTLSRKYGETVCTAGVRAAHVPGWHELLQVRGVAGFRAGVAAAFDQRAVDPIELAVLLGFAQAPERHGVDAHPAAIALHPPGMIAASSYWAPPRSTPSCSRSSTVPRPTRC